ncbi:MAG: DUF1028 domain-containing protein [Stackebrandtia sp.]
MTFSIAARSDDGGMHGVAVASKFLAVGAIVPAAQAGVGAVATQAYANSAFREQGLTLLRTGVAAEETVAALAAGDQGRARRQFGVVDAEGDAATYTGEECMDWAGGRAGDGFAIQGNILTGPEVLDEMERAWQDAGDLPFPERLFVSLRAGDLVGGDRRGKQAAALYVVGESQGYGGGSDVAVDLRVDDHVEPVAELGRMLQLHRMYFTKADPATLLRLEGDLAAEVRQMLAAVGHADDDLEAALENWAGAANLEERLASGHIDPVVLGHLREQVARR